VSERVEKVCTLCGGTGHSRSQCTWPTLRTGELALGPVDRKVPAVLRDFRNEREVALHAGGGYGVT
jgi:hypothetical protein